MIAKKTFMVLKNLMLVGGMSLVLSGCNLAYLANSDRVTQGGGNAVKANLEAQTINPSSASQYDVSGLGKNGSVIEE